MSRHHIQDFEQIKLMTYISFQDTRWRGFLYFERDILTPLSTYEGLLTLQYPYMYDPSYAPTPFFNVIVHQARTD